MANPLLYIWLLWYSYSIIITYSYDMGIIHIFLWSILVDQSYIYIYIYIYTHIYIYTYIKKFDTENTNPILLFSPICI